MTFDQRSPKKGFCLAGQPPPPRRYHHSAREPDRGLLMAATQSFFRNQARTHSAALQTLREIAADDFGERVPPFARSKRPGRSHERARLGQSDHLPPAPVVEYFTNRFLAQPPSRSAVGKRRSAITFRRSSYRKSPKSFVLERTHSLRRHRPRRDYRRVYAARIPGGVPLREHVLEDALLCFSPSAER